MDPIFNTLLKEGILGILAALGFYLFLRQLKQTEKLQEQNLQLQINDTAAKIKLTTTLEDLATAITAISHRTQEFIEEERREHAREEGRREATHPRIKFPQGLQK